MNAPSLSWNDLPKHSFDYDSRLLNLRWTLDSGQAFRWKQDPEGWWVGVVDGTVLRVRTDAGTVTYSAYPDLPRADFWQDYLRLDFDLEAMYQKLGAEDAHLAESFSQWPGLRLMRQNPEETTTSFLCTTANSIPRISLAIDSMSRKWGTPLAVIDGVSYHAFPAPDIFTDELIPELERDCNLGYRALNLVKAVEQIATKPRGWVWSLRQMPYEQAKAELMSIRGIGPKIADCVSLFALDKDEAVPVDTHIWQVANELYLTDIKTKSLTANTYNRISGLFQELFGEYAGWAQQYLFLSHLRRRQEAPVR